MNLLSQVCSLELAKRLKELGVKQDSLFYYRAWENPLAGIFKESDVNEERWRIYFYEDKYSKSRDWEISSFTVAELGEMLPDLLSSLTASGSDKQFIYQKNNGIHGIGYWEGGNKQVFPIFSSSKEADARAQMLIYLLENGLIKND